MGPTSTGLAARHGIRSPLTALCESIEPRTLLSVARPASNTGTGFFVSDGNVYDANGNPFVMKGVNAIHAWGSYTTNYNTIDQIAKTGANAVRAVMYQDISSDSGNPWTDAADTPARRQTVVERYIADGMAVIADDHSSIADGGSVQSSKAALDEITAHWLTNQPWLKTYEKYVIINIANEWGQLAHAAHTDHSWRDSYIDEVVKLRKGPDGTLGTADDITNALMIDSGQWGQDYNALRYDAQAIQDADPQHNIIFSVHLYSTWRDESRSFEETPNNDYGPFDINTSLTQLHNAKLPLVIGEWASEDFKDFSNSSAPYAAYRTQRVLQIADQLGLGWFAWSWNSSGPQSLNMLTNLNNTNYNSNTDLSAWGDALINDPTYGLKASAVRATVFDDPLPAMPNPPSPLPALPTAMPAKVRFVLEKTTIGVAEGGTGAVNVRLNQQPASNTTVNLTKLSGDTDLSLVTTSLLFTPQNWNQYQSIVLAAGADVDTAIGTAKFQLAATGLLATDFSTKEIEPPAAPLGNTFTLAPSADRLYTTTGSSGTVASVTVDSVFPTPNNNPTPNNTMYLKFPLASLRGKISSATLRVYTTNTTANRRVRVYASLDDQWTETNTASNSNPIYATYPLYSGTDNSGTLLPTSAGYVEITIPQLASFVSDEYLKDGVVTLALRMVSGTASFQTREGANPPQLVITTTEAVPPTLVAGTFDYASASDRLIYQFSEDVSASLSSVDVLLDSLTTPGQSLTISATPTYDTATQTAAFTFAPGAVPNGRYRATLLASSIKDAAGNAMLVNSSFDFFSLQGDANRDGTVGFDDLVILAQNYNQSGRTYAEGDLDGDGSVTFDDLVILAQNYNSSVAPAVAQLVAAPTSPKRPAKREAIAPSVLS